MPGRLLWLASRLTIRPVLAIGSRAPHVRWPFGVIDFTCRVLLPAPVTVRTTIDLPHATAQLVRAPGVLPADGKRRVVLYLHGGAFLTCGPIRTAGWSMRSRATRIRPSWWSTTG
ncbi:lipU domain protein [Mycobacterium xenopi 4042]|uniref:LipU domain protein n=1 Tax=Mycobacterium xenopi 4042 TaxID=1299334 RepID=X8AD40_MYCXE|nr:lipU domain protein [Mycobacterium xenopi 4042]